MASLTVNYCLHWTKSSFTSGNYKVLHGVQKALSPRLSSTINLSPRASSARRNSPKKSKTNGQQQKPTQSVVEIPPKSEFDQNESKFQVSDNSVVDKPNRVSPRSTVLQACVVTSGFIAALGIVLRQVSHLASTEDLPILDCSSKVSFDFEIWHIWLITGLVIVITSCRYLLLKTWPDFAESSEAANQQVLTSLEPLDYLVVAFLPGISEELLFRGALLPLFGFDWKSVLFVASIFGALHIGGGRKYSFAIWASFVGVMYGYATIASSSLIVPMASHAMNNLIGGILWRYESMSSDQNQDRDE